MPTVRFIDAETVRRLLEEPGLRVVLEAAMDGYSAGRADVPPRGAATTPDGILLAMPGYLEGAGLAAKLVSVFPGNVGIPSHQGLIVLFDAVTGTPLAVLDAEVITEARTATVAAIAADLLARNDAAVLTIVGGGAQARAHAEAFAPLRDWSEVRVVNRTPARARAVAAVAEAALSEVGGGATVRTTEDAAAIIGADVVALCTHADAGVIDPVHIGSGVHVSSVGSAAELPPELARADVVVVEWRDSVAVPPPAGAAELQSLSPDDVIEVGDLIAGRATGRTDRAQVTVYKSTGHAVQDVATARLVYDRALAARVGTEVSL
jgi:ornithine cyclodeaminase